MNISRNTHLASTPYIQRTGTKGNVPLKSEEELTKLLEKWAKEDTIYEAKQKAKHNPLIHNPLANVLKNAKNTLKKWVVGPDASSGPPPYDKY
jgi:hypothetical protein